MTTNHMSGIVQDTVDQVKAAGTKIYDSTVDKAAQAAKGILTPETTGPNGSTPGIIPGEASSTSSEPSSTTKTAVVAVGAALVIWGVYHYMNKR